jgi:hypothetical protein
MVMSIQNKYWLILLLVVSSFLYTGCEDDDDYIHQSDTSVSNSDDEFSGTVSFNFDLSNFLFPACVERTRLAIGNSVEDVLFERFFYEFNVYSNKQQYELELEPGTYHYFAQVACICDDNYCVAGMFPADKRTKDASGIFEIKKSGTTEVRPDFYN